MEGSYFYFFSWCGWIIATFWMKKDRMRLFAAMSILLIIIGSHTYVFIGMFQISVSYLTIMGVCFLGLSRSGWWQIVYGIMSAAIIAMLYAVFHMIELYDPVWIMMDRTWLLSAVLVYAVLLLIRKPVNRIFVICIGAVQGEAMLAIVLQTFGFHNEIGAPAFLDVIACSVAALCVLHIVVKRLSYAQPFKQKHVREG
ncbi:YphA family membrane protein [Ectobacillus panaciterrae]|uniref:YphA family membrane protein n=1 Tax=Ectobacillus panaciterrae TaxID=363872 RepID=UPI000402617F|nr:hypothetical protein [Ectobacillus panaciterrae]